MACNRMKISSIEEAVLQHVEDGGHAVLPADLLAFFVSAAVIGNGYLVNTAAQPGHLDSDLRLKTEAVGTQAYGLQHFAAKGLISHFHVAEIEVAQQIAEEGQKLVGLEVPEIEHAMGAAVKPVAKHSVGTPVEDGFEQMPVIGRIVLKVRVLHHHHVTSGLGKTGAQGRALAAIALVEVQLDAAARLALQFL